MNREGTQSFFFRLRGPIMVLLAIILLAAIGVGIAKQKGVVSYSPPAASTTNLPEGTMGPFPITTLACDTKHSGEAIGCSKDGKSVVTCVCVPVVFFTWCHTGETKCVSGTCGYADPSPTDLGGYACRETVSS